MNTLAALACLIAVACAKPSGLHGGHGVVVHGPSGVVTGHGVPIGPTGPAHGFDDGHYYGDDGDDGSYHGEGAVYGGGYGGHGVVYGNGAAIIAPAAAGAVVHGPGHAGLGLGLGLGHVGYGVGLGHGLGLGGHGAGYVALGHHGVAVQGPHTVPAVVAGPAGKIVADGLYGVPHHHHHY